MHVREIMTSNVTAITPETSLKEAAEKMRDLNLGSLPVEENGKVVGMLTDRDLTCRAVANGYDPATTPAREIMSRDVTFCYEDQDIDDVAHLMEEKHIYRLPVVSKEEKLAGILSISDLAQHAPQELTGEVFRAVSQHIH